MVAHHILHARLIKVVVDPVVVDPVVVDQVVVDLIIVLLVSIMITCIKTVIPANLVHIQLAAPFLLAPRVPLG